jgi:uncharacterized protein YdeI (YjbR/CyaY-like superfamily)
LTRKPVPDLFLCTTEEEMDASVDTSRMTREIYPMPEDVLALLRERRLEDAYAARPAYQQNDYVGWIGRAKRPETRQKRIDQMLDELESGGVYMRMKWNAGA